MDPTKKAGKIREQVQKEDKARRKFIKVWKDLAKPDLNRFYNPNFVNNEIRKTNDKEHYRYQYTGCGDSYFVSKDMYNSLVAMCRCGRPKSEGHIIKCLQKVKNKYLDQHESTDEGRNGTQDTISDYGNNDGNASDGNGFRTEKPFFIGKVPETSSGMIGWAPNRFSQLEKSTRYISPVYTMPGYKISERPYNNIFIG